MFMFILELSMIYFVASDSYSYPCLISNEKELDGCCSDEPKLKRLSKAICNFVPINDYTKFSANLKEKIVGQSLLILTFL